MNGLQRGVTRNGRNARRRKKSSACYWNLGMTWAVGPYYADNVKASGHLLRPKNGLTGATNRNNFGRVDERGVMLWRLALVAPSRDGVQVSEIVSQDSLHPLPPFR